MWPGRGGKVASGFSSSLAAQHMTKIKWTRPMLERFKKEYQLQHDLNHKQFTFDGNQFLVGYAKYLIEYLEEVLGK